MYHNQFPYVRLRRNRKAQFIRDLVAENQISVNDLVYPVFIVDGEKRDEAILSMPGQSRLSIDKLLDMAQKCVDYGIPAIALFPVIEGDKSDELALESHNPDGLVPRAIRAVKEKFPNLGVFTDVALDAYTMDGHDGITDQFGNVLNDVTNALLIKQAAAHADAGADFVCPSDMMDGRIGAIRNAFEELDFRNTGIIAYSAKYASNFYGPFRDATATASKLGKNGKQAYQMDPANSDEALHEVELDLAEGADIIMIKPGLPYLDVLARVKLRFKKPTAAYHVSGEYAMLKAAADKGFINYDKTLLETLICFKRAGADMIWTYAALDAALLLQR